MLDQQRRSRAPRRTHLPLGPGVDPIFALIWEQALRLGLNQFQLATAAGVAHSHISQLISGKTGLTTFTAALLADAVGLQLAVVRKTRRGVHR